MSIKTKKQIQIDVNITKEVSFEEILEQFTPLINSIICKWNSLDNNEVKQICYIGLWKAFETYNINKTTTFGFYAKRIILNDIYASKRKQSNTLSLNAPCMYDNATTSLTEHINNIEDTEVSENDIIYNLFINEYIKYLPKTERKIFNLYFLKKYTQKEIADILNYTQPSVCYKIKKITEYMQKIYEIDPIIGLFPTSIRPIIIRNYLLDSIHIYIKTIDLEQLIKVASILHITLNKSKYIIKKESKKFMDWLELTEEIISEYICILQYQYEQNQKKELELSCNSSDSLLYNHHMCHQFIQLSFLK